MLKRVIKTSITLALLSVFLTSCGNITTVNLDDGTNQQAPGYDENNIDAQITAQKNEQILENQVELVDLTDEQLNELKTEILTFHSKSNPSSIVESVSRYEDLRKNMAQYAYNVINRPNCEQLITEMQKDLASSRFKRHDNDSDGISDYYEMMVSGTSPLLNKTVSNKLDSQERYSMAFVMYVSQDGNVNIIEPEFANMFHDAILKGAIKPLDNQYLVLNLRAYGRELDSLRVVIDSDVASDLQDIYGELVNIYPISFRLVGTISKQMQGGLDIEHKDYSGISREESLIITTPDGKLFDNNYQEYKKQRYLVTSYLTCGLIDYLARTPTSTSLPPDDSITADQTYTLIFPKEQKFDAYFNESLFFNFAPELPAEIREALGLDN